MQLRTGTFIKHSDSQLEFIFSPDVDFHMEDAEEINAAVLKHTNRPYNMLVDMRAGVSFDFDAASRAGNNPNERKLAFLVSEGTPKIITESILNIQQVSFPAKSVKIFTDKTEACDWVRH